MTDSNVDLLKRKSAEYVASMERGSGLDYDDVPTDTLLILEALNDWSAGALAEGGAIKMIEGGDDPACATGAELNDLAKRVHRSPVVLYPISGFHLAADETLRFSFAPATYRMQPHTDGSRFSAVSIAEAKHIADANAAMNLWLGSATEDCMAYLLHQADVHGLYPDDDIQEALRRIISGHLQKRFSIGQVWNATWRAVKDAAALSNHRYWNTDKAAKQIPKKIDKVLSDISPGDQSFVAYDRLAQLPAGAVLTLFRNRFGIDDALPGEGVREKLYADAALAPPHEDDDFGLGETASLIRGVFFFKRRMTPLGQAVLSCFEGLDLDTDEPDWDEHHEWGEIRFGLEKYYAFQGRKFAALLFDLLKTAPPTDEEIQEQSVAAQKHAAESGAWVDKSGYQWAIQLALSRAGIASRAVGWLSYVMSNTVSPDDVVGAVALLSGDEGLVACRVEYTSIYQTFSEKRDILAAGEYSFKIASEALEPEGSDSQLVQTAVDGELERVAEMLADSMWYSVTARDDTQKARLIAITARILREKAESQTDSSTPD